MNRSSMQCWAVAGVMGWLTGGMPVTAASLFVATNGSDATGTGSLSRPFRSVNHALARAGAGDVIELRGGTYRETSEARFRGPGITLRSYAGERAVIAAPLDREATHSSTILIDPDADDTTLAGLDISGGYYYGVMLQTKWDWGDPADRSGACRIVIQDCAIHDTGRDAVKITPGCDDVRIERCEIYRSGVGPANAAAQNAEGIDCVNGDRVTVRDCLIRDIHSTGVYLKGGATDGLVERTRVARCGGAGILLGFDTSPEYFDRTANPRDYENIRGTVRNCLVTDTAWEGIGLYAASNPAVINNTLINVCTGGVHAALYFGLSYQDWDPAAGRPPSVNPALLNNVLSQPAGFADEMLEIRHSGDLGGLSALAGWPAMDRNVYYIAGGGVARFTDRRPDSLLEQGTLAQWRTHVGADAHSVAADPRLAGGAEPVPQADSPCIDRGTNAAWMSAGTDLAGRRRIAGAAVDSGALEFSGGSVLIDHRHTDITRLTRTQIEAAKSTLHIAYGHTSHGSQLTDGMSGLVGFANGGGKGLALPRDIFAWNNGGTGGALDLHDYALCNDVGYFPDWVACTTNYLNDPANADVNVILWSWCGQMDDKYSAGTLTNEYLRPMAELEARYPRVTFVYMTGHVDIWDDAANQAACAAIRAWCASNNRVLYDFNAIEHHDPDGRYYPYVNDDCGVYDGPGGNWIGNWATAWQKSHIQGVDWYDCGSAHSEPLNANQKAYAAWALWCQLAARIQAPYLSVSPAGTNFSSAAASGRLLSVSASVAWTAATNVPWLVITAGRSGSGNGTVVFSVATNSGTSARTGTITVAGGGITGRLAVVQAAPIVQSPAGGILTFLRQPTFVWTATPAATWYHVWISRNGQTWLDRWVQGTNAWRSASGMPGGAYRWWVQPWGPGLGFGDWAGPADFSIHLAPPGPLTQLEPVGPQSGIRLTYRWDKSLDATWYHLWVGRTGAGAWHDQWYEITGIGEAETTPAAIYPGPSQPIPMAPAGTITTNRPTFQWGGGACEWWVQGWGPDGFGPWSGPKAFSIPHAAGTWYRVYVNRGATQVIDQWTNGANLPSPVPLSSGAHSWWLGVWDAARSQIIWSDRADFTVP